MPPPTCASRKRQDSATRSPSSSASSEPRSEHHVTVRLVDVHHVAPTDVERLTALVRDDGVALMEAAGCTFVGCDVAPDLGDDVDVCSVWACNDFVAWNEI